MRLALKHQIILAPAVVLCLMTLLLAFLQYTYWDLSVKRQQARELKTAFIALAEADLATQRIHAVLRFLEQQPIPDQQLLEQMAELHLHLEQAVIRIEKSSLLPPASVDLIHQAIDDLDPQQSIRIERFDNALGLLQRQLSQLLDVLNQKRHQLTDLHREDIDELVAQTTFVTIVVLGVAILIGIVLSLTFARSILRRIKALSEGAERITRGDFSPPAAPERVQDELDALSVSINRMTEQLIRVVAAEKLLEGAEEERRRIAMDIHDQTLADLSAVRRGLEQLEQSADCGETARDIESDLQRAIGNLRTIMDNLHPQTLDILGLSAAIESHLEKVCSPAGTPDAHLLVGAGVDKLQLSRIVKVTLYRITVEAINNALRHAEANCLEVNLTLRGRDLVIAVEDNGRGFDFAPAVPTVGGGRGLHNIRERARAVGARVDWGHSRFSSGTRFELILPVDDLPEGD